MSRLSIFAAAASLCVPALALADSGAKVPALSGTYIESHLTHCLEPVEQIIQWSGAITFDPASGTASEDVYYSSGHTKMTRYLNAEETYSVSRKHLVWNNTTYVAEYGSVENGIAKYVSFIAYWQSKNSLCIDQGTFVLK